MYLVNELGNDAPKGCSNIKSLIITDNITSIYKDAFIGCTSLTELEFQRGPNNFVILSLWEGDSEKRMLEDSPLEKVVINRKSSYISIYSPFSDKETMREAHIGKELEIVPKNIFRKCSNLNKVVIEEGITGIELNAFSDCNSLSNVTLPSTLTSISNYVFNNCTSLEELTFPGSLSVIPPRLCNNCTSLRSITIPEGVEKIEANAFNSCKSATTLTLPASLQIIGDQAFESCTALTEISCDAQIPPVIDRRTFLRVDKDLCKLTVQEGCDEAYSKAPYWCEFFKKTGIAGSTTEDANIREEWYTLDGIRLTAVPLSPGIYIVRRGNEIQKTVIR